MPLGAPGWRGGIMGGMPPGGGPAEGGPGIIRPGIGWPGPIGPAVKRLQGDQIRPLFGRDDGRGDGSVQSASFSKTFRLFFK